MKEYTLLIDTGSDISWIACNSCETCPRTSGLGVKTKTHSLLYLVNMISRTNYDTKVF